MRSVLRRPAIIQAVRAELERMREAPPLIGSGGVRGVVLDMLASRFNLEVTEGQLAGMMFREGLTWKNPDGKDIGLTELRLARARSEAAERARKAEEAAAAREAARIRREEEARQRAERAEAAQLARAQRAEEAERAKRRRLEKARAEPAAEVIPTPERRRRAAIVPIPFAPVCQCLWPIGDPGTAAFRYCEVPSLAGRPYCLAHCELAYERA